MDRDRKFIGLVGLVFITKLVDNNVMVPDFKIHYMYVNSYVDSNLNKR
jgi:hypothetical protein